MKAVILWLILMGGLIGCISRLLDLLKIPRKSVSETLVLSIGIGLGAAAYAVFVIGSFGILKPMVFWIGALFIFGLGFRPLADLWVKAGERVRDMFRRFGFWERALLVLIAAVWTLSLSGALAPAIGQDELCYHLTQPKNYVRAQSIYEVPFSSNSLWPYLMHMLFTLGLLLEGESLAKLFHFTTYVGTSLAIFAFLSKKADDKTALYGLAAYALLPAAFIQSSFAYVDNALAFYIFLAGIAIVYFEEEKKIGWAALAGLFAGLAASVKLIGLFILPLAAFYAVWMSLSRRDAKLFLRGAVVFVPFFLLSCALWYLRAWILRGNPVYPFYPEFFGGQGWTDATYLAHGGDRGLKELVLFPWNLTFRPQLFGGEQIGPLFLAFLPLLVFVRPRPHWLGGALYFGLAYALLCFKVDPNARFLLPAFAFLSCAVALVVSGTRSRTMKALFGGIILVQSLFAVYHFKDAFWLLFRGDRDSYVRTRERTYFFAQTVNRSLALGDRILSVGEIRGYYFDNPFTLEGDFFNMTHYASRVDSPEQLADALKTLGFTHLLDTDDARSADLSEPEFRLSRFLREHPDGAGVFKKALLGRSGRVNYALYEIV